MYFKVLYVFSSSNTVIIYLLVISFSFRINLGQGQTIPTARSNGLDSSDSIGVGG